MRRIKLTQNQFVIVDDKNYEWLNQWEWCATWYEDIQNFYVMRYGRIGDKKHTIYMSREILGLKRGDKKQADHINHNTLDNRESNLRIVTGQQNQWNRKNPKGYYWNKHAKKYKAQITLNGRIIYLGYFNTSENAHNAYLKAKKKYHKI